MKYGYRSIPPGSGRGPRRTTVCASSCPARWAVCSGTGPWWPQCSTRYAEPRRAGPLSPLEDERLTTAAQWAWIFLLSSLLASADNLFYRVLAALRHNDAYIERQAHHGLVINMVLGWVLLTFGRPRSRSVWAAALMLSLPAFWTAVDPEARGMLKHTFLAEDATDGAVLTLFAATSAAFTLYLLGTVAAGWRLARDAGLIRPGRPSTPGAPPRPRELRLRHTAAPVLLATVLIGLSVARAAERDWLRASWLSSHADARYGVDHLQQLRNELSWFAANGQDWLYGFQWLLAGLAILAVLRARTLGAPVARESPDDLDRFWLLIFFPVVVGLALGWYVGNGTFASLWFFVNAGALSLVLRAGRGKAVLETRLQRSGVPLHKAIDGPRRHELLDRARRFREIHAKLRRLDQGQSDDEALNRRAYERELRGLHRWRALGGIPDRLPSDISVVDAALALGPYDTWWENGRRAALLASVAGIPATVLLVWAEDLRGEFLTSTLYFGFGVPGVLYSVLYWQVTWAGAGFLLGALWRRLPGRRGPARSLCVTAPFALPIVLDAVGNWYAQEDQTNLIVMALAMLLVLTITGMALDLATFRGERRYWQSRLGLLLSVYQMRYFSLQMAYLLAQLIAVFTLWQFFTDAGGPPQEGADPSSGGH
ncbi:DUF6185 family protein [Streptomyces sp. NPDC005811]|uniref:DUF6185 family protein n=1 Tax=Streptomyces sp. NPDC005811 TaxID=3154565 RepID=UPI0033D44771